SAGGLDAGGDAGGAKPGGEPLAVELGHVLRARHPAAGGENHAIPSPSGRPNMRLRFWIACDDVPFHRLSMTLNTMTRPVRSSLCTETRQMLVSRDEGTPGGPLTTSTNGSSAYASR